VAAGLSAPHDILFERRGAAGVVTLNRPQALNAVTHDMVRALATTLAEWRGDMAITRVVITAAGERAFSAGGDIRALYDLAKAGRHEEALEFWRDEYPLNAMIKDYPKPYIALIDGIVMGGGFGVSMHGSRRVAGDRFRFAMPEVGIGFFPDVGATHLLPRLPGAIGTYVALTGERLSADEAVAADVATHHVPSARFADLLEALCGGGQIDATLDWFAIQPGEAQIMDHRLAINRLFGHDRVEDILAALDAEAAGGGEHSAWASATTATIRSKSPTSLKIALKQMRLGPSLTFAAAMRTEFRIVSRIVHGHDFYEGVRAVIIDKDNMPRWHPADLAAVSEAEVERYFAPLGAAELDLR
jgi:enoyl-CoA hydratase